MCHLGPSRASTDRMGKGQWTILFNNSCSYQALLLLPRFYSLSLPGNYKVRQPFGLAVRPPSKVPVPSAGGVSLPGVCFERLTVLPRGNL